MIWNGLGGCVSPEQWRDGEQEATEAGAIDPGPVLLYQCFPDVYKRRSRVVGVGGEMAVAAVAGVGWGVRVCVVS